MSRQLHNSSSPSVFTATIALRVAFVVDVPHRRARCRDTAQIPGHDLHETLKLTASAQFVEKPQEYRIPLMVARSGAFSNFRTCIGRHPQRLGKYSIHVRSTTTQASGRGKEPREPAESSLGDRRSFEPLPPLGNGAARKEVQQAEEKKKYHGTRNSDDSSKIPKKC